MKSQNCLQKSIPYILTALLATWCYDNMNKCKSKTNQIMNNNLLEEKIDSNTVNMSDIEKSPLKIIDSKYKNLKNLLWMNQFEYIMSVYNSDVIKYKTKLKKINWEQRKIHLISDSIKDYNVIKFPNIYDPIRSYFPDSLEDFKLKYPEFKNDIWEEKDCFIAIKAPNNKFVLLYYKKWKLFIATHISPWTWDTTKNGKFKIKFSNDYWNKYRRSIKYDNSPIPYSIPINEWIFIHVWIKPDGTKKSHWCLRVPWLYQQKIFNDLKNWQEINVIIKI